MGGRRGQLLSATSGTAQRLWTRHPCQSPALAAGCWPLGRAAGTPAHLPSRGPGAASPRGRWLPREHLKTAGATEAIAPPQPSVGSHLRHLCHTPFIKAVTKFFPVSREGEADPRSEGGEESRGACGTGIAVAILWKCTICQTVSCCLLLDPPDICEIPFPTPWV